VLRDSTSAEVMLELSVQPLAFEYGQMVEYLRIERDRIPGSQKKQSIAVSELGK
jgi:hypothetical protein